MNQNNTINQIKSNIFDNTNKSKINKQTIDEKQPAIRMKTPYDEKCVDRDTKAGDLL